MATFVCRDRLNIVLTRDGSRGCRPVIEGVKTPSSSRPRSLEDKSPQERQERESWLGDILIDRQPGLSSLIDRRRVRRQEVTRSPGEEAAEKVDLDPRNRVNAIQLERVRRGCR